MDPKIADYIARNQGKYTREAIRQQLIEAGHDPAAIDATWAVLMAPDPDEAGVAGEGFWPRFFAFLTGLNVAVFLLVAVSTGMLQNLAGGTGALLGVFAVALGIGALLAWAIVAAVGPAKLGRTTALVIGGVIPIVFALLIGTSCYALASAIGPPPPPPIDGELELRIDAPTTLQATAAASCQPYGDDSGYGVFANDVGRIEGRVVSVSLDYSAGSVNNLSVSVEPTSEGDEPRYWSNTADSQLEVEITDDGLSGQITFESLSAEPFDEAEPPDPISGRVRWTCG